MLEFHIRKFGGNRKGWVHVAKGCGEDDVVAGQRHLGQNAFGVSPFRHGFNIGGFDLVAESFFNGQQTLVVLVGPAEIADWANVDKADFGCLASKGCRGQTKRQRGPRQDGFDSCHINLPVFDRSQNQYVSSLKVLARIVSLKVPR